MLGQELETNITEIPYVDPLVFEPQNLPNFTEAVSIGVERNITRDQRKWLSLRDCSMCSFPVINEDGTFGGYLYDPANYQPKDLNIHHIHEIAKLRRSNQGSLFLAQGLHNNPTNLITLNASVHTWLHKTGLRWVNESYKRFGRKSGISCPLDWALSQQIPITKPNYDIYLTAIATTRSLYMLEKVNDRWFPFERCYKGHIENKFWELYKFIPEFIDSFIDAENLYE